MDIGTAKPTREELATVPHHLIDIRDPLTAYSAAEFASDARACVNDISSRGKVPLLVGGTMLYFKALLEGLNDMPSADPGVRAFIQSEAAAVGWPAMHQQLMAIDPITASRLAPADSQRISRALEVFRVSGKTMSSFQRNLDSNAAASQSSESSDSTHALNFHNVPMLSLEPADRKWLHQRIEQRFDDMLAHGFMEEVKDLRARGDLQIDLPSMRCVGYRQAWEGLDAGWPASEIRERGVFATRQLAKRQITWLRSMPQRLTVMADGRDALAQVQRAAQASLG